MTDYRQAAREAAARNGIDPDLFERQIGAESNFDPNAGSPAGAQGIAQIMPATAKGWGVNPHDPMAALDAAAKAMAKYVRSYGSYRDALVAYNAGPGRVGKPLYSETAKYIQRIMGDKAGKSAPKPTAKVVGLAAAAPPFKPVSKYGNIFAGGSKSDEWFGQVLDHSMNRARQAQAATAVAPAAAPQPVAAAPIKGGTYKDVMALGSKFGLAIQGDFQTTGGKHTKGSLHYAGKAVDYGDANNSPEKLRALAAYAQANPGQFKEFFYDPLGWYIKNGKIIKGSIGGHGDHAHAAFF